MEAAELVAQIHKEIDTAADILLQERPQPKNRELYEALEKKGFIQNHEARTLDEIKKKDEVSERALYYKTKYPFLKFVTADTLDRICGRYGLVWAPTTRYMGKIPVKNAQEIIDRDKIDEEDIFTIDREGEAGLLSIKRSRLPFDIRADYDHSLDVIRDGMPGSVPKASRSLFIAAAPSMFDTRGLKQEGYGFINKPLPVPDPIVFRFVKGGLLIITKWGVEAGDPELTIPEFN